MDCRSSRISRIIALAMDVSTEIPVYQNESNIITENVDSSMKPNQEIRNDLECGDYWPPVRYENENYFTTIEENMLSTLQNDFVDNKTINTVNTEESNQVSSNFEYHVTELQNFNGHTYEECIIPMSSFTSECQPITNISEPTVPFRVNLQDLHQSESTNVLEQGDLPDNSQQTDAAVSVNCIIVQSEDSNYQISSSKSSVSSKSDNSPAVSDPDYSCNGDNECSSDEDQDLVSNKKTRKRQANPTEWKANKAKKLRNNGKKYESKSSKAIVDRRKVRPGCSDKCIYKCSSKIKEQERFKIFQKYWGYGDLAKQRDFISRCLLEIKPGYQKQNHENSRRTGNVAYYFTVDGRKVRVCKQYFMATLDISATTITTVRKKLADGVLQGGNRGKHGNHRKLPDGVRNDIRSHINSIPRIPSHYVRAQSDREFIEGGRTISQIYRDYVEKCKEEGKVYAKRTTFFEVFNEFNISFFIPKKDQCELCTVYENSQKKEKVQEYEKHQQEKNLSRKEKESDKNESDASKIVCIYDLQAALPTPRGDVSVFYYKSKLSTYNLTVYDLKTSEAVCNVWHEGKGHRGVNEIATSVFKYIEEKAKKSSGDISFIFYSDNCGGQQKNKFMIMMYMYALCVFRNIATIQHKFLIKGHTQNEGDTVHSVIEKEIKRAVKSGSIYVPSQYYQIMRTAKKKAPFFAVKEFSHFDFIDFKALANELGDNFTTNTNNETFPFADIKILKISRENPFIFNYKTSYQDEMFDTVDTFHIKPKRKTRGSATITLEERIEKIKEWAVKNAYSSSISIAQNKKQDLMYLIEIMCETDNKLLHNRLELTTFSTPTNRNLHPMQSSGKHLHWKGCDLELTFFSMPLAMEHTLLSKKKRIFNIFGTYILLFVNASIIVNVLHVLHYIQKMRTYIKLFRKCQQLSQTKFIFNGL